MRKKEERSGNARGSRNIDRNRYHIDKIRYGTQRIHCFRLFLSVSVFSMPSPEEPLDRKMRYNVKSLLQLSDGLYFFRSPHLDVQQPRGILQETIPHLYTNVCYRHETYSKPVVAP